MQSHYGFISTLYLKNIKTPYYFKKQFTIYSLNDPYPRKKEVETYLKGNFHAFSYSHALLTRTRKQYTLSGDFVKSSRNNFQRFLNLLRIIKPNNSFLNFEAYHTGMNFQSSSRHDIDEHPSFISLNKDVEILNTDFELVKKSLNILARLKPKQEHRINNFYSYLDQSIKGIISHRIIWFFISLESLFHLEKERDNFTENFCKRVAYTLEPANKLERIKFYNSLFRAGGLRGSLIHGAPVNYKDIHRELLRIEPSLWKLARFLILDKKSLKLFSSLDSNLKEYFKKIDSQSI